MYNKDIYIIGIGVSTGGLEAINKLFKNMNKDINAAFIISKYIDYNRKLNIMEILRYQTSFKIKEAYDEDSIEKNTIYIIPENTYLDIDNGKFKLYKREENQLDMTDKLFDSIAREKKDKAIGVILSGTIKDGIEGIKKIRQEGGLVIVQNEDSAEFTENIKYAATTGAIDYVLPPESIITAIRKYIDLNDMKKYKNESTYEIDNFHNVFKEMVINEVENVEINRNYIRESIQELKQVNSELKDINEKLKINNDELYLINRDYKTKIEEVLKEKNKIDALINILDFTVINLNEDLVINSFTGKATKVFGLLQADIGKKFYNINTSFNKDKLIQSIEESINSLSEKNEVIQKNKSTLYKIKIIPNISKEGHCIGVAINGIDISDIINDGNLALKLEEISYQKYSINESIHQINANYIIKNRERLAEIIMENHYEKVPSMRKVYTEKMHNQSIDDKMKTFDFIKLAIDSNQDILFTNYIEWLCILLVSYNVPMGVIKTNFEVMLETFKAQGDLDNRIEKLLEKAISIVGNTKIEEYYKSNFGEESEICRLYLEYLLNIDKDGATKLILDIYNNNKLSLEDIYLKILEPVMNEVGRLWQRNLISVTQEHFCTSTTKAIVENISQNLHNNKESKKVFLGACVSKELHEIGLRVVSDIFKLNGWNTYYLGANTPEIGLIKFIKDLKVDILALSASMMVHVEDVKKTIEVIRNDDECKNIKIIVGGYIFNQSDDLWKYVGADGYGKNAEESFKIACDLISNDCYINN